MSYVSVCQNLMAGIGALVSGVIVYQNAEGRLVNYDIIGYISIAISIVAYFLSIKIKIVDQKNPSL